MKSLTERYNWSKLQISPTVVLILRTYALFERSRRVLVLLLVVAFGGIGVACVSS